MRLIDERQVGEMLGVSVFWVRKRRREGGGPKFFRIGGRVRYSIQDVEGWLNENHMESGRVTKHKVQQPA
jgi:predicted DNA-binding transcriptional regulator AlpA